MSFKIWQFLQDRRSWEWSYLANHNLRFSTLLSRISEPEIPVFNEPYFEKGNQITSLSKYDRQFFPAEINQDWKRCLQDSYGRFHDYLRISLTEKCNLRCQYCMPAEGVPLSPDDWMLTTPEIVRFARICSKAGVRKIRLTGGEPTIRKDFKDLIMGLSKIPGLETFGMTTNAIVLNRFIPQIQEAQINAMNISLDTLIPARYTLVTRRNGFKKVWQAIETLIEKDFCKVKINCVIMRGFNDDEINDFVRLTQEWPIEIRFIEYMPFTKNGWNDRKLFTKAEILETVCKEYPDIYKTNTNKSETSEMYYILGHKGSFGVISSMSDMFCSTCNRLRLTADGNLKNCLFGTKEYLVRDILRANLPDNELIKIISTALWEKAEKHGGMEFLNETADSNRSMVRIGG